MAGQAFQDQMRGNHCWGCGPDNPSGLHLKSYWQDGLAIAQWSPSRQFAAGPRHFLNGGIIATLLDCHGVCTAIADAYQRENREVGSDPYIWHATAALSVDYRRPTPIDDVVQLTARVVEYDERGSSVACTLAAAGKERAGALVRTARVPDEWLHGLRPPGRR